MPTNETYKKKLNSKGEPILKDGDFVMELVSSQEIPDVPLTIEQINQMQSEELKKTDGYYIRKIDKGIEVPKEIQDERDAIRLKYDALKAEIK